MGASSIEWTESTWNPVVGCSKVSPGCAACYAETFAARLRGMALAKIAKGEEPGKLRHYIDAVDDKGRWSGKLIPCSESLAEPYTWKKPRMIFVNSMSDLFHEDVPASYINQVLATIYDCQWHTFQILTKRAGRAYQYLSDDMNLIGIADALHVAMRIREPEKAEIVTAADIYADLSAMWPLPNLWLGVSVEDRKRQSRVRDLIHTPAAVRFVSAEPLLGRLDLSLLDPWSWAESIDWLIVGCESHGGAVGRLGEFKTEDDWWDHARELIEQCRLAGVKCFVKQGPRDGRVVKDPAEFPAGEWPREWPVREESAVRS